MLTSRSDLNGTRKPVDASSWDMRMAPMHGVCGAKMMSAWW
ncbi:TPA: hypothetical protein N0F65_007429 [Lagenidium giganteum]|uniref:Uncharacterized protein n=1 Tax=Lagenidium giganteum TaxID=4803 RepID=A0AAV2ZKU7_9STRA|nr:TPA: hypothetical protein N0F65_007429 [Lagenidium giganteum]